MRPKSTPPSLFDTRDAASHAAILTDTERDFTAEEGVTTATTRARSRLDAPEHEQISERRVRCIRVDAEDLKTESPEDAMNDRIDQERERAIHEECPASNTRLRSMS